jgi:hypothetical protein
MSLTSREQDSIPSMYNGSVAGTVIDVSTDPTLIYYISMFNPAGADAYLQMFNTAAANVTLGTTTPHCVHGVGTKLARDLTFNPIPIRHNTALSVASTTTRDGSTGSACEVTIGYISRAD